MFVYLCHSTCYTLYIGHQSPPRLADIMIQVTSIRDFVRRQDREMKRKKRAGKTDQPQVQNLDIYQPNSVQEEVRDFGLYGNLRKADTEVRNPLPSPELIDREKHVLEFDKQRRKKPHDVHYKAFYRYLSPALSEHYTVIPKSLPSSASTTGNRTS